MDGYWKNYRCSKGVWRHSPPGKIIGALRSLLRLCFSQYGTWNLLPAVALEAYHNWSGEAADAQLRVNFMLKLLLSQNFCNRPLMRFISFASNIGPAAAVPAGPASAPLTCSYLLHPVKPLEATEHSCQK